VIPTNREALRTPSRFPTHYQPALTIIDHHQPSLIINHHPSTINLHSSFFIHHSSFIIHHSSFIIHHSFIIIIVIQLHFIIIGNYWHYHES
jgi:hypothetical protein